MHRSVAFQAAMPAFAPAFFPGFPSHFTTAPSVARALRFSLRLGVEVVFLFDTGFAGFAPPLRYTRSWMHPKILVSAGGAPGGLYASLVVAELRGILPGAEFFGCTGPRLRAAGVRTVVDAASLAVVGLLEVVSHIPRIYGEYRKLLAEARLQKPDLAILTDSPDFHLPVARRLHRQGVPVVYLVAPQA